MQCNRLVSSNSWNTSWASRGMTAAPALMQSLIAPPALVHSGRDTTTDQEVEPGPRNLTTIHAKGEMKAEHAPTADTITTEGPRVQLRGRNVGPAENPTTLNEYAALQRKSTMSQRSTRHAQLTLWTDPSHQHTSWAALTSMARNHHGARSWQWMGAPSILRLTPGRTSLSFLKRCMTAFNPDQDWDNQTPSCAVLEVLYRTWGCSPPMSTLVISRPSPSECSSWTTATTSSAGMKPYA